MATRALLGQAERQPGERLVVALGELAAVLVHRV